jgi:hypothetical protein
MFVLVLLLSASFTYFANYENADQKMEDEKLPDNIMSLHGILDPGRVSPKYIYNAEHAAKLKEFSAAAKANQDRPTKTVDEPTGVNENYPLPARPKSMVFHTGTITEVSTALDEPTELKCGADQGVLYVKFTIPDDSKYKYVKLVRAELYRGEGSADKIDLSKPYDTLILGPEEGPAPGTAPATTAAATTAPAAAPDAVVVPPRNRNRDPRPRRNERPRIPENMKWVRGFKDNNVDQKITYFYKVRLVGRMTVKDGDINVLEKAADGTTVLKSERYHAPTRTVTDDQGEKVEKPLDKAPSLTGSSAQLYATPFSKEVHATAPTNYKLRLAGVHGDLPSADKPRDPADPLVKTYEGSYEVIVWIKEAQNWLSYMIAAHEGEMLSGTAKYKVGDETKTFDFTKDLGYKMLRIDMEEDKEAKINPKPLIETATLLNMKTNKEEKFPKAPNIQRRQEWLSQLDSIIDEQNEQKKANMEKTKAAIEKNKADADARRAAQPPAPVVPPK